MWEQYKKYEKYIVVGCILVAMLFALAIRLMSSSAVLTNGGFVLNGEPDISYNLRLVELALQNFPSYPWFDPMTLYPTGEYVYWGPMFTMTIVVLCKVFGATALSDIVSVGAWVPPLFAIATIPVLYYIGKTVGGTRMGIFAAIMMAVMPGQFLYRSMFGGIDHHIAEVFFGALFIAAYLRVVHPLDDASKRILYNPGAIVAGGWRYLLVPMAAGGAYILGYLNMPTMIMYILIVLAYTTVQCILDAHRGQSSMPLLVANIIIIGIVGVFAGIFHIVTGAEGPEFIGTYGPPHVAMYGVALAWCVFLASIVYVLQKKERLNALYFMLSLAVILAIGSVVLFIVAPNTFTLVNEGFIQFLSQSSETETVIEARAWSVDDAIGTFGAGIFASIVVLIYLLWALFKRQNHALNFVAIWGVITYVSVMQHVRYEYYLSIVIALLVAMLLEYTIQFTWSEVGTTFAKTFRDIQNEDEKRSEHPHKDTTQRKVAKRSRGKSRATASHADPIRWLVFIVSIVLVLAFAANGVYVGYAMGIGYGSSMMESDWRETLSWMANETPDTGVDYLTIYDNDTFVYPNSSYGVMSWWDYGHWITFFAHRIPIANPFQHGVIKSEEGLGRRATETGAAHYFMSQNETEANAMLDSLGAKYVITDVEMDVGKFWAMATWDNSTLGMTPYTTTFLTTDQYNPTQYTTGSAYTRSYYHSMQSRLHNFDGSARAPRQVIYLEMDPSRYTIPVLTFREAMNSSDDAYARANATNDGVTGDIAEVVGINILSPTDEVPALGHYRLIYESSTNVMTGADLRYVKIFEYVKGARIQGSGILTIEISTNQGRNFTYVARSQDGMFIIPYAEGMNGDVYADPDSFMINGMPIRSTITEADIQNGNRMSDIFLVIDDDKDKANETASA